MAFVKTGRGGSSTGQNSVAQKGVMFSHFKSIVSSSSSLLVHISQSVGFSPNTIGFFPGRTRAGLMGWTMSLALFIFLHPNNAAMTTVNSPIARNATTSVGDPFAPNILLIV
jgi:hypothetical protein